MFEQSSSSAGFQLRPENNTGPSISSLRIWHYALQLPCNDLVVEASFLQRLYSPSTWICLLGPSRCPPHDGRRTLWWEQLVKHDSIPVRFLAVRNISFPFGLGLIHHFICYMYLGIIFQCIYPAITYAITKLFLLTPENFVR